MDLHVFESKFDLVFGFYVTYHHVYKELLPNRIILQYLRLYFSFAILVTMVTGMIAQKHLLMRLSRKKKI